MIVWITSSGRSGNTFFRVVLHQIYGVHTYAAFNASEVLLTGGAEDLVGYKKLPAPLAAAIAKGTPEQIRLVLEELDAMKELFILKTHARANELFGTNYRAILLVRDGRDAMASYANYLVDIRYNAVALRDTLRRIATLKAKLLSPKIWIYLTKSLLVNGAMKVGLRRWLVSKALDDLLRKRGDSWGKMNRSWLERECEPVVVYFNDLIRDPIATVTDAIDKLGIGLVAKSGPSIPSFAKLKQRHPGFFRKGTSGDWKNYFSSSQEELFKSKNGTIMRALNFPV